MVGRMERQEFVERCLVLLQELIAASGRAPVALDEASTSKMSVWELGFDSALMVELIVTLEEIGFAVPDDLPWESITLIQLYEVYEAQHRPLEGAE